jgi:hypothetical protein
MAIKIIGKGQALSSTANDTVYTPPGDVISATVASGTVENKLPIGAKLYIRIGVRNTWVINGKDIQALSSPLVLPPITMNPGERLEAWSDIPNALDLNITIGEQR